MPVAPALAGDTIYQGAAHIIITKGLVKADWKYIFCEGDVTVKLNRPENDRNVSGFGTLFSPIHDETIEVTFTPASQIDAAILTYLYGGILAAMPGASWYGATSTPIWVHTMAGRIMAIANARPTTFPAINFGICAKRFDGAVTLTGVLDRGVTRATANSLFTPWATETFTAAPDDTAFPCLPCSASWVSLNGTNIEGMEGWKLTPKVTLVPRAPANLGTIDYTVMSVELEASATPANLLDANLWASYAIGSSRQLGTSVAGGDLTLTEDAPGLVSVVKNARLVQAPTVFDISKPIAGQCIWRSRRKSVTGTWTPAGTLAVSI
jgi:hypothetical protein